VIKFKEYINEKALNATELDKNNNYKVFIDKYSSGQPFELVSGGEIKLIQDPAILARLNNRDAAKGYKLQGVDGKTYLLSKLKKTNEFGGEGGSKFNKGDVAEGILASALATKFEFPNKKINATMIRERVVDFSNGKTHAVNEYGDTIELQISLKDASYKAFINPDYFGQLEYLYDNAAKFANSRTVEKYAKYLANNSTEDHVISISDGIGDEKGTKIDNLVKIGIDGAKPRLAKFLNLSTKAGNSTLEQTGIGSYKGVKKLFDSLEINIDRYGMEKSFDKTDLSWYQKVFKRVTKDINKELGSDKKEYSFMKKLSGAISNWGTKGQPDVTLVDIKKFKVQSFKNLSSKLSKMDVEAVYSPDAVRPNILIQDKKSGETLLSIRVEWRDPGYAKNAMIQKGKALDKLISI